MLGACEMLGTYSLPDFCRSWFVEIVSCSVETRAQHRNRVFLRIKVKSLTREESSTGAAELPCSGSFLSCRCDGSCMIMTPRESFAGIYLRAQPCALSGGHALIPCAPPWVMLCVLPFPSVSSVSIIRPLSPLFISPHHLPRSHTCSYTLRLRLSTQHL